MSAGPRRLGAVSYLNARPLWAAFEEGGPLHGRLALDLGLPSVVARRLAEDEVAAALVPVAAAATLGGLALAGSACIGASGPVRSVVIVAERPLHELETVALDLSSRTSAVLARLVLARRGLSPRLVGLGSREAVASVADRAGALVIGDPALALEGRFAHTLDLAEAWREWTGLPFVFAAWFARPGALSEAELGALEAAAAWGLARRGSIAAAHADAHGGDPASLASYLDASLRYELDDEAMRGLERFLDEAAAAGLLPPARFERLTARPAPRAARAPSRSLDAILARAEAGARLSGDDGERL
ncbi:MAG TPA: hypothetical protein PLR99_18695, partial [Polyangiaceae bacterium]|nr:hypothetical protein [Polyangiaceae bacterium]